MTTSSFRKKYFSNIITKAGGSLNPSFKVSLSSGKEDVYTRKLKESFVLMKKKPSIINLLKTKKPLYKYLLSDESKQVFDYLKKLSSYRMTISSLATTLNKPQSLEDKRWMQNVAQQLQKTIDNVSYAMSDAFTELNYVRGGEADIKRIQSKIDDSKGNVNTEIDSLMQEVQDEWNKVNPISPEKDNVQTGQSPSLPVGNTPIMSGAGPAPKLKGPVVEDQSPSSNQGRKPIILPTFHSYTQE